MHDARVPRPSGWGMDDRAVSPPPQAMGHPSVIFAQAKSLWLSECVLVIERRPPGADWTGSPWTLTFFATTPLQR